MMFRGSLQLKPFALAKESKNGQQDHGANQRGDQRAYDATAQMASPSTPPATANERADNADDDVTIIPKHASINDPAGERASNPP